MSLTFAFVLATALAVAGALPAHAAAGIGAPAIWTDQADYAPGDTVYVMGDGWDMGEAVHIDVNDNLGQTWSRDVDVVADLLGNISDQFVLPDWFIATYSVTATGATSGTATTTFTDGNVRARSNASGTTYQLDWTEHASAQLCNAAAANQTTGSANNVGFSGGARFSKGVPNANSIVLAASDSSNQGGVFTGWTGDSASDTYVARPDPHEICVPGNFSGTREYVASYQPNATPTVTRVNTSVTVDEGQNAANSGTFGDTNALDTVTVSASVGTITQAGTRNGTWSWSFGTTDGPAQNQTVTITATDNHGASSTTTFSLAVNNVAPTASFPATRMVNEGNSSSFAFTSPSDPSSADTNASFHYAFACAGASLAGATYASSGTASSVSCSFDDGPSTPTVRARIIDKDNAFSEYTAAVAVTNVAPTATFSNDGPVNEGSSFTLSLSDGDDVSSADKAAKFEFAFDCGDGGGYGAWSSPAALSASASCATSDNGARAVKAKLRDKNGGEREYSDSVTVDNVTPSATFDVPDEVDESSSINLSLTDVQDAGSADTHQYRFSCDSGSNWSAYGNASTHSCPTSDDGTMMVMGQVRDDDGGESAEYSKEVTVKNVAPSATFTGPDEVDEGSEINLSLTDVQDPGSEDTHQYRFSCDGGGNWSAYGDADAHSCPTSDNGMKTVKGQVRDDDGGESAEYSKDVTVKNVAPTVTLTGPFSSKEGDTESYSYSWIDPGSDDTFPAAGNAVDCGPAGTASAEVFTPGSKTGSFECTWSDDSGADSFAVNATVTDDDGGAGSDTKQVDVDNVAPTVSFTGGPTTPNEDKSGSELYTFSVSDPGDDGFTVESGFPDCGSGGSLIADSLATTATDGSFRCRFSDGPASPTARMQIRDADEPAGSSTADSNVAARNVAVNNVAPIVNLSGPGTADEGETKMYSFTVSDPGDDTFSFVSGPPTDYPTCGQYGELVGSPTVAGGSFQCRFIDGPHTTNVAIKIKDDDGGVSSPDVEQVDIIPVQIANVAPTVTAAADQSSDEGETKSFDLGSFSDDGSNDDPWVVSIDWGDGSAVESFPTSSQGAISHSHTYADNGSYTVSVSVADKDHAASAERTFQVTVSNVAPFLTGPANQTADEGASTSVDLGSFSDEGASDAPWTVAIEWGDGALVAFTTSTQGAISRSHTYDDNGSYTVKVQVTDKDGAASGEKTFEVAVANVAPTATFNAPNAVDEGSPISIALTSPDDVSLADRAAGFTYAFDCGSGYGAFSGDNTASCSTNDNGTRTVKGKIRDKDGGERQYTKQVAVDNLPPSATFNAPSSVNEGSNISLSLTEPSDPSTIDTATGFTYAFDCGDGSGYSLYTVSNSKSCPTSDNGTRAVKGKIRDKDGGEREYTKQVAVGNVAPQVTVTSPEFGMLFAKPGVVAMSASFTDAGKDDSHTCSFSWDDTTSSAGTVAESQGSGTCTGNHTYTAAGVYTIKVTVSDDDGASTTVEWMVIVYDPNAGFITGGGWLNVAPGSYPAQPTLSGRANFGFNSQYKKGATVPTGETEFQFHVGNFNFHSTKYDFLVVSGYKAQYKGSGEINGVPGYSFRLTAYDGALMKPTGSDRFRIKVMDAAGIVVFDNRLGQPDDVDLAEPQMISGGSIVIHKA